MIAISARRLPTVGMAICLTLLSIGLASRAQASASAAVAKIEPVISQGQLALDIDLSLSINTTMRQTLELGVPLYFAVEVQISQPRWWWFDKQIRQTTLLRRLSFNTLTRQWQAATGDVAIATGSFEQALQGLERVRAWPIVFSDRFEPGVRYEGRVRVRLDNSLLARPLQIDSSRRQEWVMNSPWQSFDFSILRSGQATP